MVDVDVETGATSLGLIPNFAFRGIQRIEIPKVDSDFATAEDYGLSILAKYMPKILSKHRENAEKIEYLRRYYQGVQDISHKTRLYQKDCINNNKIVENHALRQVDFKVGFLTGEQREYTAKSEMKENSEAKAELSTLAKYLTDCGFYGKDKDLKEWVYSVGVGVGFCAPRTDIIEKISETDYVLVDDFDIENQSPFEIETLSPIDNFVVYSTARGKKPLFCVSIVEVEKNPDSDSTATQKEIHIETRYASFVLNTNLSYRGLKNLRRETVKKFHYLPMVEHYANSSRMGLIELNKDLFNSINTLVSSVADMVVDNANVILVFRNVDITGEQVRTMKQAGAIIISDKKDIQNTGAGLDTITIEIPFAGLNEYYEQRLTQAYDIAGVPLASGQVTSGGDTGQARLLGGGWNNAYTIIKNDMNSLLLCDYDMLKLMLYVCKLYETCPIDKLNASQVDIKYRINQSDNFLVKAQGINQLYATNMPKDIILKYAGISSDIGTEGAQWEAKDKEVKSQATKEEVVVEKTGGNGNEPTAQTENNA